MQSFCLLD